MDTIKEILSTLGYDSALDLDVNEAITLEVEAVLDLTIERIGETQLSVNHSYTQMGDLMYDPEIVFDVDAETGEWTAVEYTVHPHTYQYDENGLESVQRFADYSWDKNLRHQGFVDAAVRLAEGSA
mgnify:CR=1 FL=1